MGLVKKTPATISMKYNPVLELNLNFQLIYSYAYEKTSNFLKRPEFFIKCMVSLIINSLVTSLKTLLPCIRILLRCSLGKTDISEPIISVIFC